MAVNAKSIGFYLQSQKDRYKTNWLGTTKSLITGKTVRGATKVRNLDPEQTSVAEAVALFEQQQYLELAQRPEGATTALRFHTFHDLDSGELFVQVESYVAHNQLEGVTDVAEVSGPLKDQLLAALG